MTWNRPEHVARPLAIADTLSHPQSPQGASAEVRVRRHAQEIRQEARTLPPKPGVILSHHRAFIPTSSVLFLCFGWMRFSKFALVGTLTCLIYGWETDAQSVR